MNPDQPSSPRDAQEAQLTALLLGELTDAEAEAVRQAIAQDADLARLHQRLQHTIGLVREAVAPPAGAPATPAPTRLSEPRRQRLLQHFQLGITTLIQRPTPRRLWWSVPVRIAAALVLCLGLVAVILPHFIKAKSQVQMSYLGLDLAERNAPATTAVPERRADEFVAAERTRGARHAASVPKTDLYLGTADARTEGDSAATPRDAAPAAAGRLNVYLPTVDSSEEPAEDFYRLEKRPGPTTKPTPPTEPAAVEVAAGEDAVRLTGISLLRNGHALVKLVEAEEQARPEPPAVVAAMPSRPPPPAPRTPAPAAPTTATPAAAATISGGAANRIGESELLSTLIVAQQSRGGTLMGPRKAGAAPAAPTAAPAPPDKAPARGRGSRSDWGEPKDALAAGDAAFREKMVLNRDAAGVPLAAEGRTLDEFGIQAQSVSGLSVANGPVPVPLVPQASPPAALGTKAGGLEIAGGRENQESRKRQIERFDTDLRLHRTGAEGLALAEEGDELKSLDGITDGRARYFNGVQAMDPAASSRQPAQPALGDAPVAGNLSSNATWSMTSTVGPVADSRSKPAAPAEGMAAAVARGYGGGYGGGGYGGYGGGAGSGSARGIALPQPGVEQPKDMASAKFKPSSEDKAANVHDVEVVGYLDLTMTNDHSLIAHHLDSSGAGDRNAAGQPLSVSHAKGIFHSLHDGDAGASRFAGEFKRDSKAADRARAEDPGRELARIELPSDGARASERIGNVTVRTTSGKTTTVQLHDIQQAGQAAIAGDRLLGAKPAEAASSRPAAAPAKPPAVPPQPETIRKFEHARLEAKSDLAKANEAAVAADVKKARQEAVAKAIEDRAAKTTGTAPVPQPEVQTRDNAFSTFSLNVSDVSFKLAAASLEKGAMPDPSTVRSEEFINAFDYRDPEPAPGVPIAFAWERARYPFAHNRDLLRFSVQTAARGREPGRPLNLVLVLDNSGSMERADRVRIIQECLLVLAGKLQKSDRVSVVTFARTARLWVDGVAGNQVGKAFGRVGTLTPEGGTNLEEALTLAYQTARRHFLAQGVNRVVVLTDGAANLGNVDPAALKAQVEAHRTQGIALDCFGIGWEGYNDDLLEVLSRNGDGRYGFVNTPEDAAGGFAAQLAGALQVAASDVKVQVEFNPRRTTAYRQIGYAKHQLKKEQFRDNTVDAAEIGAAESGNALYVVEVHPAGDGPIGVVRVRYKVPGTTRYLEHAWTVPYTGAAAPLDHASPAMRLAATASAFSEWLVASPYAAEVTTDRLLGCLRGVPEALALDPRPQKLEWMIRQAQAIAGRR
ncbi:MAG: von Willebrand factor type A domain-containing protein [Verrucomicrobia bacterium]|nr:von Willebrand factor type A domain-containing protein [Verrucomicrobiota bacterium]